MTRSGPGMAEALRVTDPRSDGRRFMGRLPKKSSTDDLLAAVRTLVEGLQHSSLTGKLWMVEIRRIREFNEEELR